MEAARSLTDLPERLRIARFTAECERLRPLGIAYALKHFGGGLDRADAEDAVAEVVIRFHRLALAHREPTNLRAAFFTSVRNASIDLLRSRGVRPTVPLEAAATETSSDPGPADRAESHDDAVRLREAMARMRPNYREAIVLRFGLGLTVPEIAARLGLSLPAAKKLVLRSTAQIRARMESITGAEFCPEMREIARRSLLDEEVAELGEGAERAALRAHLEHCGACRTYLSNLRSGLHELGGGVLLAGLAAGKLGLLARLAAGLHSAGHAVAGGADRLRLASYRAGGAISPEGGGPAGLLAGTGQKLAAVCTAGAATTATCLATGIVGPGLGVGAGQAPVHHPAPRPAHVKEASTRSPQSSHSVVTPVPVPEPRTSAPEAAPSVAPQPREDTAHPEPHPRPKPEHHAESQATTPSETEESEFGIEAEAEATASATPPEPAPPPTESRSVESVSPSPESSAGGGSSSVSPGSGSSGGRGHEEFGFGG